MLTFVLPIVPLSHTNGSSGSHTYAGRFLLSIARRNSVIHGTNGRSPRRGGRRTARWCWLCGSTDPGAHEAGRRDRAIVRGQRRLVSSCSCRDWQFLIAGLVRCRCHRHCCFCPLRRRSRLDLFTQITFSGSSCGRCSGQACRTLLLLFWL